MTDLSLPPGIATLFTAQSLVHRGRMGQLFRATSSAGVEGALRLLDPMLTRSATDRMRTTLAALATLATPATAVDVSTKYIPEEGNRRRYTTHLGILNR